MAAVKEHAAPDLHVGPDMCKDCWLHKEALRHMSWHAATCQKLSAFPLCTLQRQIYDPKHSETLPKLKLKLTVSKSAIKTAGSKDLLITHRLGMD